MRIRPIRTTADHEQALREVERLWSAPTGSPAAERLEVLATLIAAYEASSVPISPPDPVEALHFRMDQMGLTRQDLEPYIGSRSRVSEVLSRRRPLTLAMIRRLHEGLGLSAEILIQPTLRAAS